MCQIPLLKKHDWNTGYVVKLYSHHWHHPPLALCPLTPLFPFISLIPFAPFTPFTLSYSKAESFLSPSDTNRDETNNQCNYCHNNNDNLSSLSDNSLDDYIPKHLLQPQQQFVLSWSPPLLAHFMQPPPPPLCYCLPSHCWPAHWPVACRNSPRPCSASWDSHWSLLLPDNTMPPWTCFRKYIETLLPMIGTKIGSWWWMAEATAHKWQFFSIT